MKLGIFVFPALSIYHSYKMKNSFESKNLSSCGCLDPGVHTLLLLWHLEFRPVSSQCLIFATGLLTTAARTVAPATNRVRLGA